MCFGYEPQKKTPAEKRAEKIKVLTDIVEWWNWEVKDDTKRLKTSTRALAKAKEALAKFKAKKPAK